MPIPTGVKLNSRTGKWRDHSKNAMKYAHPTEIDLRKVPEISDDERDAARLIVAQYSASKSELRELLDMLGLI